MAERTFALFYSPSWLSVHTLTLFSQVLEGQHELLDPLYS